MLKEDGRFTSCDEALINRMDVDKIADSITVLTLKKRIMSASKDWLYDFFSSGGQIHFLL